MDAEIKEIGFIVTFALLVGFGYFNISLDDLAFTQPAPPYRYLSIEPQEAYAEELNVLSKYNYDPLLSSALLVIPTAIDFPPPDPAKYFAQRYSNGIEIERGFIEFQEFFFENINKFDFLPPILPSAFAINLPAPSIPAPDFFDDFTTDKGWSFNGTDVINIFTATGTINITQLGTGAGSPPNYRTMGSLDIDQFLTGGWDESKWTLRAKLQMNASTNTGGRFALLGISEKDQTFMSGLANAQNCNSDVSLQEFNKGCLSFLGGASNHWVQASHNATVGANGFGNTNLNLTEPYILNSFIYPEIIVDEPFIKWTIYSDADYQHVLGCTNNKFDSSSGNCDFATSINDGVTAPSILIDSLSGQATRWNNLKFLWFGTAQGVSQDTIGTTGSIHEVSFWNGINITQAELGITAPEPITDLNVRIENTATLYSPGAPTSTQVFDKFPTIITQVAPTFGSATLIDSIQIDIKETGATALPTGTVKAVIIGHRGADLADGSTLSDMYFIENSTNSISTSLLPGLFVFNFSGNTILDSGDFDVGIGIIIDSHDTEIIMDVFATGTFGKMIGTGADCSGSNTVFDDESCSGVATSDLAGLTIYGGPAKAVLSWSAPADNGDAITGYEITIANATEVPHFFEMNNNNAVNGDQIKSIGTLADPVGFAGQRITFPNDVTITSVATGIGNIGIDITTGTIQAVILKDAPNGTGAFTRVANSTQIINGSVINKLQSPADAGRITVSPPNCCIKTFGFDGVVLTAGVEYIIGIEAQADLNNAITVFEDTVDGIFGTGNGVFTTLSSLTSDLWLDNATGNGNLNMHIYGFNYTEEVADTGTTNTEYTSTALFPDFAGKINAYSFTVKAINSGGSANASNFVEISPDREGFDVWQWREFDNQPTFDVDCNFFNDPTTFRFEQYWRIGTCTMFKVFNATELIGSDISVSGGFATTSTMRVIDGAYDKDSFADFPKHVNGLKKGAGLLNQTILSGGKPSPIIIPASTIDYASSTEPFITVFITQVKGTTSFSLGITINEISISNIGTWNFTESPRIIKQMNQGPQFECLTSENTCDGTRSDGDQFGLFEDDRGIVIVNSFVNGTVQVIPIPPEPIIDLQVRIENTTSIYSSGASANTQVFDKFPTIITQVTPTFSNPTLIDSIEIIIGETGVTALPIGTIQAVIVGDRTGDLTVGSLLSNIYFIENSTNTISTSLLPTTAIFNFSGNTILDSNDFDVGVGIVVSSHDSEIIMDLFGSGTFGKMIGTGADCAGDNTVFDDQTCSGIAVFDLSGLSIFGGNARGVLSWTAPADNGNAITGYKILRTNSSQIQIFDERDDAGSEDNKELFGNTTNKFGIIGQRITFPFDVNVKSLSFGLGCDAFCSSPPEIPAGGIVTGVILKDAPVGTSSFTNIANSTIILTTANFNAAADPRVSVQGGVTKDVRIFFENGIQLTGGVEYVIGLEASADWTFPVATSSDDASDATGHPNSGLGIFTKLDITTGNIWQDNSTKEWGVDIFGLNYSLTEIEDTGNTNTEFTSTADFPSEDKKINAYSWVVKARNSGGLGNASNFVELSPDRTSSFDAWSYVEHDFQPLFTAGCDVSVSPSADKSLRMTTLPNSNIGTCILFKSFEKTAIDGSDIRIVYENFGQRRMDVKVFDGQYDKDLDFPLEATALGIKGAGILSTFPVLFDTIVGVHDIIYNSTQINYVGSTENFITLVLSQADSGVGTFQTSDVKFIAISNIGSWNFTQSPRIIAQVNQTFGSSLLNDGQDDRGLVISNSIFNGTVDFTIQPGKPFDVNATAIQRDVLVKWTLAGENATQGNTTNIEIKRNGTTIATNIANQFTGVFFEDFNSFADNATADLVWTHNNCNITSPDGFCGVNSTSGKIIINQTSAGKDGITYDLLTNEGFQLTNANGEGDFTLLFDIDYKGESIGVGNYFVGIGNETGLELPSKDTDYLGMRLTISTGFLAQTYSVFMSDNQDRSLNLLDAAVNINQPVPSKIYFNMTFDSDSSTFFTTTYSDPERTMPTGSNPRINTQAGETYNNLRYILLTPFGFGSTTIYDQWEIDNVQLFVNGTIPTSYLDINPGLNTLFNYTVIPSNSAGDGPESDAAFVTTNDFPNIPTSFTAIAISGSEIGLDWTIPSDYGEGSPTTGIIPEEIVIFKENTTDTAGFFLFDTVSSSQTSISDLVVDAGKTYTYKIAGQNSIGVSANTTDVIVLALSPPDPITGLVITQEMNNNATLNWDDATGADNYQVLRKDNFTTGTGFAVTNQTWYFREADGGGALDPICFFTISGVGSTGGFRMQEADGGSRAPVCTLFKTFPRDFLNGSRIQVNLDVTHGSPATLLKVIAIVNTLNEPDAYDRADDTVFLRSAHSFGSGTEVVDVVDSKFLTIGGGRITEDLVDFESDWDEIDTDFASISIQQSDTNALVQSLQVKVFWINITDFDTGLPKAFYNFSGGNRVIERSGLCTVGFTNCDYGFVNAGTFNFNSTFEIVGTPITSDFEDSTISLQSVSTFKVRGNNSAGFGLNSTEVDFGLIQPITNLNATALNSTAIKLTWDLANTVHQSDPLTGVIIQRESPSGAILFEDPFEIQPASNGWTETCPACTASSGIFFFPPSSAAFRIASTGAPSTIFGLERSIDTTGVSDVAFNLTAHQLSGTWEVADFLSFKVDYGNGSGFLTILQDVRHWSGVDNRFVDPDPSGNTVPTSTGFVSMGSDADNNPNLKIRIEGKFNSQTISPPLEGYFIDHIQVTAGNVITGFVTIVTVDELDTMFTDTGLTENTNFTYQLKGQSAVSTGAFGVNDTATTLVAIPPPDQVTGLIIAQNMNNNATLDWDDATGADNYQVLRNINFTQGANANANSTWQFREQHIDPSDTNDVTSFWLANPTNLQFKCELGECYTWKTFPRDLINGTNVDLIYETIHTTTSGLLTYTSKIIAFNATNQPERNDEDQWEPKTAKDFVATNNGILIRGENLLFNSGIVTQTISNIIGWTLSESDYVTMLFTIRDANVPVFQNPRLNLHSLNFTDLITGDPVLFINFSNSVVSNEIDGDPPSTPDECEDANECLRGTFNVGNVTIFNQGFELIGSPVISEFTDTTIPLSNIQTYKIRGNNTAGFGLNSTEVDFGLIQPIKNLNATGISSSSALIEWGVPTTEHPTEPLDTVVISRNGTIIANIDKSLLNYTDFALDPETNYGYNIKAHSGDPFGWNVTSGSLVNEEDISSSTCAALESIYVREDGTRLYVVDRTSPNHVCQFSMTSPFDTTTLSFDQLINPRDIEVTGGGSGDLAHFGLYFKSDGTKMYLLGDEKNFLHEFDLSTAWDISTATWLQEIDISSTAGSSRGLFIRSDGLKAFINEVGGDIEEYDLTTAWDISTLSHVQTKSGSGVSDAIYFRSDGLKMIGLFQSPTDFVREYDLTTAWDISTLTAFVRTLDVTSEDGSMQGLSVRQDGLKMFTVGNVDQDVNEYNLSSFGSTGSFNVVEQVATTLQSAFPPNAPTGFAGIANTTDITLSWNNQTDKDSWTLSRNGTDIALGLTVLSFQDVGVPLDANLGYILTAINGTGTNSTAEIVVKSNDIPSVVTGVGAMPINGVAIVVEWDDPVADDGEGSPTTGLNVLYDIFRRDVGLGDPFSLLTTIAEGTALFNDTTVIGGHTFSYQLSSRNEVGSAANSTEASAMVDNALIIRALESDGVTDLNGDVSFRVFNSTFTSTKIGDGQGRVSFPTLSGIYNFTIFHIPTDFLINKTTASVVVTPINDVVIDVTTQVHRVNCASNGPADDFIVLVNSTSPDHFISDFTSPVCDVDDKVSWNVLFEGFQGAALGGGGGGGNVTTGVANYMSLTYEQIAVEDFLNPPVLFFDGFIGNSYKFEAATGCGGTGCKPTIKVKEVFINFEYSKPATGNMSAVVLQGVFDGSAQGSIVLIDESDVLDLSTTRTYPINPVTNNGGATVNGESIVFNFTTPTEFTITDETLIGFRLDNVNTTSFIFESWEFNQFNGEGECIFANNTDNFATCPNGNIALGLEIGIVIENITSFETTGGIEPSKLVVHHTFNSETQFDSAYPKSFYKNSGTLQGLADISVLNAEGVQANNTFTTARQTEAENFGLLSEAAFVGINTFNGEGGFEIGFGDVERTGSFNFLTDDVTDTYSINMWVNGSWTGSIDYAPVLSKIGGSGEDVFMIGIDGSNQVTLDVISDQQPTIDHQNGLETVTDDVWSMITVIVEKSNLTSTAQICVNAVCDSIDRDDAFQTQDSIESKLMIGEFVEENFASIADQQNIIEFSIDELCIWKGYKLTTANLLTLNNSGSGSECGTVSASGGGGGGPVSSSFTTQMKTLVLSLGDFGNNAKTFIINGSALPTTFGTPIITSDPIVISTSTSNVLLNFDELFLQSSPAPVIPPAPGPQPSPPPRTPGGGGTPEQPPQFFEELFGFSLFAKLHQLSLGQIQDGTIDITWNSPSPITIESIKVGEVFITWVGFPSQPFTIEGSDRISTGKIPYRIMPPSELCDEVTGQTINCVNRILYDIPVTIHATVEGQPLTATSTIKVNLSLDITLALFTVFIAFAGGIAAIIYRAAIKPKKRQKEKKKLKTKSKERKRIESGFARPKSKLRRRP